MRVGTWLCGEFFPALETLNEYRRFNGVAISSASAKAITDPAHLTIGIGTMHHRPLARPSKNPTSSGRGSASLGHLVKLMIYSPPPLNHGRERMYRYLPASVSFLLFKYQKVM
jgi:hypothetical protein